MEAGRTSMIESNQRKKVMIVDDSEIVLTVAQLALESAGFDVITHPRPAGCIALILQASPDLLLIDVNMPGLAGDTVVKMLGATHSNAEMIVLLYSTLQADVLEEKANACRAHGFIRKSESQQDLVRQVSRWIRPHAGSGSYNFGSSPKFAREGSDFRSMVAVEAGLTHEGSDSRLIASRETALGREGSDSRLRISSREMVAAKAAGKILLVDQEMVTLSTYRRLVISQPGSVEFALSGTEVLRRLQSESPPDVVVLGKLDVPPNRNEVLREAARLSPRWKARFIVVQDGAGNDRPLPFDATRLRRPITEASLCSAIQGCLQSVS